MLSLAAFAAVATPQTSRSDGAGFDPGIFSLLGLIASSYRRSRTAQFESGAADLLRRNGGQLSDEVERRIAAGYTGGRF